MQARLTNVLAAFCIIGWRVFWLTMTNRVTPTTPAETVLTKTEIAIRDRWARNTATSSKPPTPTRPQSHYLLVTARLGGYLARTKNPPPGNMVLWRGLTRLTDIQFCYELQNQVVGN